MLDAETRRERQRVRVAQWRKENPERQRLIDSRSYQKHRETILADKRQQYRQKLEAEAIRPRPDHCEVCGDSRQRNALHFDHDHGSGEFRGWLCARCNQTLGLAKDDAIRLRALADYLEGGAG